MYLKIIELNNIYDEILLCLYSACKLIYEFININYVNINNIIRYKIFLCNELFEKIYRYI